MCGVSWELACSVQAAGEPVLADDVPLLRMHPARKYHDKEVVAYRADAPHTHFCYGVIVVVADPVAKEDSRDGATSLQPRPQAKERQLVASPFGGVSAHMVQTGGGRIKRLLPSDVWCFVGTIEGGGGHTNRDGGDGGVALVDAAAGSGGADDGGSGSGGGSGAEGAAAASPAAVVGGELSTAEYLRAARVLLARANLPLSDGDQQVFASNLALQSDLAKARGAAAPFALCRCVLLPHRHRPCLPCFSRCTWASGEGVCGRCYCTVSLLACHLMLHWYPCQPTLHPDPCQPTLHPDPCQPMLHPVPLPTDVL
jgi:hypothetical protein